MNAQQKFKMAFGAVRAIAKKEGTGICGTDGACEFFTGRAFDSAKEAIGMRNTIDESYTRQEHNTNIRITRAAFSTWESRALREIFPPFVNCVDRSNYLRLQYAIDESDEHDFE